MHHISGSKKKLAYAKTQGWSHVTSEQIRHVPDTHLDKAILKSLQNGLVTENGDHNQS